MRLEGKTGIVIGAGQQSGTGLGNGRATALALAREGARLLLVDASLESVQETADMIRAEGGVAECSQADVAREADCRSVVEKARAVLGRIDLMQFNVGIAAGDSPVTNIGEAGWDRIIDVNLRGALYVAKYLVPVMRDQQGGSMIFVSSIAAVVHSPLIAYKASKAGMHALAQTLAVTEAEHGIRINVIMPGLIETPMAIEGFAMASGRPREDIMRERDARVPLRKKMGSPWDVAWASVFLHSDEANFITGAILPVDGGQCARGG